MGCCDKTKRKGVSVTKKIRQIATGFGNLARGKKYEFTTSRVRTCRHCDDHYWIKHALFCSVCKCYIPAKARVEENTCPENLWVT